MSRSRFALGALTGVAAATLAVVAWRRQQKLDGVGGSDHQKSPEAETADESGGGAVRDLSAAAIDLPNGPSTPVASYDLALAEDADIGSAIGDPSPKSNLLCTEAEAASQANSDVEPLRSTRRMESNGKEMKLEIPNGDPEVLKGNSDSVDAQNVTLADASPAHVDTAPASKLQPTAIVAESSVLADTAVSPSSNGDPLKDDTNQENDEQHEDGGDDGEMSPKRRRAKKKKQHPEHLDSSVLLDSSVDHSESGDFVEVAPGDASPTDVSAILKARTKKVRGHQHKSGAAAVAVKELHSSTVETKKKKKNKNKNF